MEITGPALLKDLRNNLCKRHEEPIAGFGHGVAVIIVALLVIVSQVPQRVCSLLGETDPPLYYPPPPDPVKGWGSGGKGKGF